MTTKLEAMVGHLAGRKVDAGLLEELDDPSSEASRFLEATRNRSRALLDELDPAERFDPRVRKTFDRRWWIVVSVIAIGMITLIGLAIGAAEARLRRLEADLAASQSEARASALRLETALGRLAEAKPPIVAQGPVEAALNQLDRRLEGLERRVPPSKADPAIAQVRDEMALLRRELSLMEKGDARKSEELQASIHEAARLIKLLINQAQPSPTPSTDRPPGFPTPRPIPAAENRRVTP